MVLHAHPLFVFGLRDAVELLNDCTCQVVGVLNPFAAVCGSPRGGCAIRSHQIRRQRTSNQKKGEETEKIHVPFGSGKLMRTSTKFFG